MIRVFVRNGLCSPRLLLIELIVRFAAGHPQRVECSALVGHKQRETHTASLGTRLPGRSTSGQEWERNAFGVLEKTSLKNRQADQLKLQMLDQPFLEVHVATHVAPQADKGGAGEDPSAKSTSSQLK
jgi:hypothetical protein